MNILAFGNSDSTGAFTGGRVWSEIAREQLEARSGEAVGMTNLPFSVIAPTAVAFAERKVKELSPDLVVLLVGSFAFTAGFTWVRVRRLFGERVGRWYREAEERFEQGTRGKGTNRDHLNTVARRVIRRLVGTQPMATREQVTEAYRGVLQALAQRENIPVVLITYPGRGAHARSKKAIAQRRIFFRDLKVIADAHRFAWIDGKELFDSRAPGETVLFGDGLHFNAAGHQLLGEALVAAVAATGIATFRQGEPAV